MIYKTIKIIVLCSFLFYVTAISAALFDELYYEVQIEPFFRSIFYNSFQEVAAIKEYCASRFFLLNEFNKIPNLKVREEDFIYLQAQPLSAPVLRLFNNKEVIFEYAKMIEKMVLESILTWRQTYPFVSVGPGVWVNLQEPENISLENRFFIQRQEEMPFHNALLKKFENMHVDFDSIF